MNKTEIDEAKMLEPGQKIIFVPPKEIKTGVGLQESSCHSPTKSVIYAGDEFIVSYLLGYNKERKLVFKHMTLDEPVLLSTQEEITEVELYLDSFDNSVNHEFFQTQRPKQLNISTYSIDTFVEAMENDTIPANQFLVELIDNESIENLYYLSLKKYYLYLDMEIHRAKNTSMDSIEKALAAHNKKAEELQVEPKEYDLNELYRMHLVRQNQKLNFFTGTKNICKIVEKENNAKYYGEIIEQFKEGKVKTNTLNNFYGNLWLAKKEFQVAVMIGYEENYSVEMFEKYKW